jgi:type II secretory ATPase GspE/PulE/Tfp pilus assembly ATPase PilB-like protein
MELSNPSENALQDLEYIPPDGLADMCYFRDGILYVDAKHIADPSVMQWEMQLLRMKVLKRKQQCSHAQIAARTGHLAEGSGETTGSPRRNTLAGRELGVGMQLVARGVEMKASDIHFVFKGDTCDVKYRVDGFLDTYTAIPKDDAIRICSALYVASGVKNSSGFSFQRPIAARLGSDAGLPPGLFACRFASIGTEGGGAVVLRLLYDAVANRSYTGSIQLKTLGFSDEQVRMIEDMASAPNGLIIIDGPTGSGKSTTLKYTLQWVHQTYPQFNILTVEDPPEYPITGAQQIPVLVQDDDIEDPGARSRAYGNIITTTLRLDPDILMVGEIRDATSALSALRAAITGHRLWTTLHANDAWEAVNRLIDLLREAGMVDPVPVLANTQNLTGLMAQRLVPVLCPHCKRPLKEAIDEMPRQVIDELMNAIEDFDPDRIFVRGDGCERCVPFAKDSASRRHDKRRGIIGRTVVAEIVRPDQGLLDVAREHGIPRAREYWMEHRGGKLLADQAIDKIRAGLLDPLVAREFIGPLITARQVLAQRRRDT